jgi:hypothetical protein
LKEKGTIRMARVCLLYMTTLSESFYIKKIEEEEEEEKEEITLVLIIFLFFSLH